jgi:hypothetical protein
MAITEKIAICQVGLDQRNFFNAQHALLIAVKSPA